MRLKEIDIKGFKSFSDKTKIEFKDGITAVVGPNGSGKSNISDAVRWVLGEQSIKTLRGAKMEDVIFAGTKNRKPLGFAEVTITFDNKSGLIPIEYEEVAITRRVFRSGESEYFLNKNGCRLKDIRELLMDTGIGKEGYSIIGQGRIGEILSNNPTDRRGIFEEAAGIIKYKSKKDESIRKLKRTDENLIRINDLLSELVKQEGILKKQSEKAVKYQELFNSLKDMEINLLLYYIKNVEYKYKQIKENEIKYIEMLEEKEQLVQNLSTQIEELKFNIQEKENDLKEKIDENLNLSKSIDGINYQINLLEQKINHNKLDLDRIVEDRTNMESKKELLLKEKAEKSNTILEFKSNLEKIKGEYSVESKKIVVLLEETKNLQENIEKNKDMTLQMYNNISDKKSELNSIKSIWENMDKRLFQLNQYINNEQEKLDNIVIEKESFKKNILKKDKDYNTMSIEIASLEALLLKSNLNINNLKNKLNDINISIERNISSYNLYKKMEDSYEGYYKGVKNILKISETNENIKSSILGVVADLIRVDEDYEIAISTALGSSSQFIVTNNQQGAKNIINKLYETNGGRITCLPIDKIKGKSLEINKNDIKEFNIIGVASDIVKFDIKYKNIIDNLLGKTIIIKDMDSGIKLSNKYNNTMRIVTLTGNLINPGGSMTGGSQTQNGVNILSRKNQIDKIFDEIKLYEAIKEKTISEIEIENQNIFKLQADINDKYSSMKSLEFDIVEIKSQLDSIEKEIETIDRTIRTYKKELQSLQQGSQDYVTRRTHLDTEIIKLEKDLESLKENILIETERLNILNLEKELEYNNLTDRKILINKKDNELKNIEIRLKDIDVEVDVLEKSLENIDIQGENRNINIVSIKKEIKSLNSKKNEDKKLLQKLSYSKETLENILEKMKLDFSLLNEESKKNYGEKEKLKSDIQNLKLEKVREEMTLESYITELMDKYELTFDEALKFEDKDIDVENIKPIIKADREKITKLGNVNLNSIEEYNLLSERLYFITSQKNDLLEAKADLEKVIYRIEKTMKDIFIRKFEEINQNFKEIFKVMFNGGEANLIIEDKNDILNSGIDIQAMPPGKKLQNLSSLSGGERSLIAVSLLFAILKIKPSPFCILDEIDAALDEANIGRYTNYLNDISEKTQFIIITHRKKTMEMADMLYGVTMEEQGISKLISIELKDYEEDAS